MKIRMKYFGMLRQELIRMLTQPWCFIALAGCVVIKFVCVFGTGDTYQIVFERNIRSMELITLAFFGWESFLAYVPFCLCAFPCVGSVIQDSRYNRMNFFLPRCGCLRYAAVQVTVVFLTAFSCMVLGDCIFMLVGHFGLGLPFGAEKLGISNTFLAENYPFAFWIVLEIQRGMQAVFYALIAMIVSFWVKDMQFVTILPMVFLYFTTYFLTAAAVPIPRLLGPKEIYMYNWGAFAGNDIAQVSYAVFFTVMTALLTTVILYTILKRQVRK